MLASYFTTVEKPVLLIQKLFSIAKVSVSRYTISETLLNHPAYPSLLSLYDSLRSWNIETRVARISKEELDLYPVPFIADCYINENKEYILVTEVNETKVHYYFNENKLLIVSIESFIQMWSGICVFVKINSASGEKDFYKERRKERLSHLRILLNIGIILTTFLFALYSFNKTFATLNITYGYGIWMFLKLIGVVVTGLLLWYEIDKNATPLQKICTARNTQINCSAILNSKYAKLFSSLSWSEIGFFYFTSGYLSLQLTSVLPILSGISILSILVLLNLVSLPYTIFSIYYQWQIAKQWCILCLVVQAIIIAENFVIVYTEVMQKSFTVIQISSYIMIPLVLMVSLGIIWFQIKPYFIKANEARITKREYAKLKFDEEILETLLEQQKKISFSTEGLGIVIGNPNATKTIIKICNPYCISCAKAHSKLDKLLQTYHDLRVQIIFMVTSKEDDRRSKPVKHLLAIAAKQDECKIRYALDDWYLHDNGNYKVFSLKYPMNNELNMQDDKILAMEAWCLNMKITYTPTIFLNGKQLPNVYSIDDLDYLLL